MERSISGQVRHGCTTITQAVRAGIQRSQALLARLSRELGINRKTFAKWRKWTTVEDMKTGSTGIALDGSIRGRGGDGDKPRRQKLKR
jgi:arylsulfatase A-like enzyme